MSTSPLELEGCQLAVVYSEVLSLSYRRATDVWDASFFFFFNIYHYERKEPKLLDAINPRMHGDIKDVKIWKKLH